MPQASSSTNPNVDDMFHAESFDGQTFDDASDEDDGGSRPSSTLTSESPAPAASKRRRETQDVPGGFTYVNKDAGEAGRRKIRIEYITDKSRRHITFSKRKAGIMKKAYELSILTGTQVLLLVVSETGLVYTFTTSKLQPLVTKAEGKSLIQACLNAPDGIGPDGKPSGGPVQPTKSKNGGLAIRPHKLTAEASKAMIVTAAQVAGATADEAQAHAQLHAQQQSKVAAAIGNGTPVSQRPKKRMPSRKRTASQPTPTQSEPLPEIIPPVPPIPDMHRQHSPSTHMIPQNTMQSPINGAYHIPQEYPHHAAHHNVPSPTYAYPPTPTSAPDYSQPPQMYAYPQGPQFIVHPGMYQPQGDQQQHQQQQQRRMMPPVAEGSMGGMIG